MKETKFKDTEIGKIPEEWEVRTINSFCSIKTGPFGSMLHAEDYVAKGTPIVTTEHFKNGILPLVGKDIPQVGIEDLKRKIDLGEYSVDTQELAKRIIKTLRGV